MKFLKSNSHNFLNDLNQYLNRRNITNNQKIDQIVNDQLRLDYNIRVEEKKAEVIGTDDASNTKPLPVKIKGLKSKCRGSMLSGVIVGTVERISNGCAM